VIYTKPFESEAFFITFNSKYEAKLIKAKIRDGTVLIDDGIPRLFYVDQTKPLYLTVKHGFKTERLPLYIIKWDSVRPYEIEHDTPISEPKKTITKKPSDPRIAVPIDAEKPEQYLPKFNSFEGDKTPEYIAKLVDLKIMSNLMGRGSKTNFIWIMIALLFGVVIGYLIYKSGIVG